MQRTRKRQERTLQTILEEKRILGGNQVTNTLEASPGEMVEILNCDIFSSTDHDYLKSRRGTQYLKKASGPVKRNVSEIQNRLTWDIGSEEYLITQEGTAMYSQALLTTGNPTAIALATGGSFTLGSSDRADLFISGDKLYVMHPSANYVIRWTGTVFVAYPMGLAYPYILAVTSANSGVISGSYTLGIEKVYRVSGVDLMASTPNRKLASTRILATTGTISSKKIKITIQSTELDNDSLWTHLRVWRSKNKNVDNTDPLNPIDAQGNDDELYEEALITKAEMAVTSLTSVATGSTLPPGNAGTQAGKITSVYTIELNNADSVFFNLIGSDSMELLPIPACEKGCFCSNRIFFSGVQDSSLDDFSKNNIWYSNYAGTKYAFQYSPLNFIDTGRDGQAMVKLIAFEKDLICLKESKTGRLPSGNVDLPFQILDDKIGTSHPNLATYIPTVGIVCLTSESKDFKIFGYDLRWTEKINGIDVGAQIRYATSGAGVNGIPSSGVFFAYINGKLILSDTYLGFHHVLHIREGRGWTLYYYPDNTGHPPFTFANGTRAAYIPNNSHLVEIEVNNLDTDVNATTDTDAAFGFLVFTRPYRSNEGRDILEHEYLSVTGSFVSGTISAAAHVNGLFWPTGSSSVPVYIAITPNASVAGSSDSLREREYRYYPQPSTIGDFKWAPVVGNYLAYIVTGRAPCMIRSIQLCCTIDENGMAWGAFDPFQSFPNTNTDPTWAQ